MKPQYHTIDQLIAKIDEPNRSRCWALFHDNGQRFSIARGSSHNHQAWEGGYLDHLTEVMNLAVLLYPVLDAARALPFSLSDALLVLYLHDLEKPWKYEKRKDDTWKTDPLLEDKERQVRPFVEQKIEEYGFSLTLEQQSALRYVEGEKKEYSSSQRMQSPLAAFAHLCDVWSARGWFDYPKIRGTWE